MWESIRLQPMIGAVPVGALTTGGCKEGITIDSSAGVVGEVVPLEAGVCEPRSGPPKQEAGYCTSAYGP